MNKKYLSLFIVMLLVFVAGAKASSAQTRANINADLSTEAPVKPAPVRADVKANLDAKLDARMDVNADLKTRRETASLELKTKREALKKEVEARKTEIANMRTEVKEDSAKTRLELRADVRDRITMSFSKLTENLSQISARINSRIEKMKADGADTASAEEFMVKAETSISASIDFAVKTKAMIDAGANAEEIKASAMSAKDALKDAHQNLRQAVQALKEIITEKRGAEVKSITEVNVNKVAE